MGADPDGELPLSFMKPADALQPTPEGETPEHPCSPRRASYHEVEMAVVLGAGGRDIPVAEALDRVWGYAVALDMTRRDLQDEAKALRRPWEFGKAADRSGRSGRYAPRRSSATRDAARSGCPWTEPCARTGTSLT